MILIIINSKFAANIAYAGNIDQLIKSQASSKMSESVALLIEKKEVFNGSFIKQYKKGSDMKTARFTAIPSENSDITTIIESIPYGARPVKMMKNTE